MRILPLSLLTLTLTPTPICRAQAPIFHTATNEALVDAIVTDKQGVFQRDLTRSDFHLFQDGKEQSILSVALESAIAPGLRNPHFIAIFVEMEQPHSRDQIRAFIDRFAAPDLHVALYVQSDGGVRLLQPFTTDAKRLQEACAPCLLSLSSTPPSTPLRGCAPAPPPSRFPSPCVC